MMGVVGEVRRSVEQVREWFIKEFIRQQKPELDKKIDEMLKSPKLNRIMQRFMEGMSLGARLRRGGIGKSIGKTLSSLRKLS